MAKDIIIGREYEQHILQNICEEKEARLVAIYGRRRVGKTYLVKQFFNEKFDFFFTGSFEAPMKAQLALFSDALYKYSGKKWPTPKDWFEAFRQLWDYLSSIKKERIVVFLVTGKLGGKPFLYVGEDVVVEGVDNHCCTSDRSMETLATTWSPSVMKIPEPLAFVATFGPPTASGFILMGIMMMSL